MQPKVRSIKVKSTLAVLLVTAGLWSGFYTNVATASAEHLAETLSNASIVLPPGMSVPDRLPQIRDLNLLTGWLWLWNTHAGAPIAEYIRDNNVLVEYWNGPVNSAPVIPVTVNGHKQVRSTHKIQISNQTLQTQNPSILAGMLAHEGYHTQLPFGPNQWPGSIYEEFQAYELQQKIYTELYERGWTGNEFYHVPVDLSPFDKYDRGSLTEFGQQLGQAYAKCRLYPWDN
jgi:hypothetical protein